jgi:hypothetical protein
MHEHLYDPLTVAILVGLGLIVMKIVAMMPLWLVVIVAVAILWQSSCSSPSFWRWL